MLNRVEIAGFRSVAKADLELGPITLLFGPTASGKSSALYAALVLRNFVLTPNQAVDGLFNLGFLNLGGFEACVFDHQSNKPVTVKAHFGADGELTSYGISLTKAGAKIYLTSGSSAHKTDDDPKAVRHLELVAEVSVPYPLNQTFPHPYQEQGEDYTINWNGITCQAVPKTPTAATQASAMEITTQLNDPCEGLKKIDVAPHRRGFFKPSYSPSQISPTPTTEDEVATLIINDPYLPARISVYMEEVFDRDFRLYQPSGTATAFLQTTEKRAKTPVYLVNDGFGVNQVVYMLAKTLRPEVDTVLIEEPEVHLHPTIIHKFARVVCSLVRDERKQLVFTTHSEQFLIALLACVSEGILSPADLRCYHATRTGKTSQFDRQEVMSNGQIEGGLTAFIEAEMGTLQTFLSPKR